MSSKFVTGDPVRVTNPNLQEFDRVGVVTGYAEIACEPASQVQLDGIDFSVPFKQSSLTLADPDVHTVLDQMDAESALPQADLPPHLTQFEKNKRTIQDAINEAHENHQRLARGGYIPPHRDITEQEIDGDYVRGGVDRQAPLADWEVELLNGVEVLNAPDPDPVHHPSHYTSHASGVECIQITRHMGFNLGNAFKYIWRADLKGAAIQDLEKAIFYIQDEIAKRKAAQ